GQDQVEVLKIRRPDLPGALGAQIDRPPQRGLDAPLVRRLADMIAMGSRRSGPYGLRQACLLDQLSEHPFGGGRTAVIARANEQNADHIYLGIRDDIRMAPERLPLANMRLSGAVTRSWSSRGRASPKSRDWIRSGTPAGCGRR